LLSNKVRVVEVVGWTTKKMMGVLLVMVMLG